VSGAYCLSFETFRNATDVAPSRKARATFLLSSYDFLDKFFQVSIHIYEYLLQSDLSLQLTAENGQTLWFRTPFAHPGVTGMVEYMLCTQQFRQHVKFTSSDWESRLINVFALAGTFCRWVVSRYSVKGWLEDQEFYTLENEIYCAELKNRMLSLSGDEKIRFFELLDSIRAIFLNYHVY
jgi:hypothetical protein